MKKLLLIVPFVGALLAPVGVEASAFTLNSYTVNVHTTDPGLMLWEKNLLATPDPFNLNQVGDTFTQNLFQLGTDEKALNLDDIIPYSIAVGFNFVAPDFKGTTQGITGAAWWGQSFGYVLWDNPLTLAFGQTGLLGITLSNATFGLPGSAVISATFKLVRADTATIPRSVPEPSSLMLLGVGALGVLVYRRRVA
jgi:PEP-CTERM motif-containing protein